MSWDNRENPRAAKLVDIYLELPQSPSDNKANRGLQSQEMEGNGVPETLRSLHTECPRLQAKHFLSYKQADLNFYLFTQPNDSQLTQKGRREHGSGQFPQLTTKTLQKA